jgi:hypothetical protein
MFGEQPSVVKPDYAKWMLEDPRINFAISNRGQAPGVNHLGLQAEDDAELEGIHANLQKADAAVLPEKGANCCYAKSDKYWVTDPQGIAWESFRSLGSIPLFGGVDGEPVMEEQPTSCGSGEASAASCCTPAKTQGTASATTKSGCCART